MRVYKLVFPAFLLITPQKNPNIEQEILHIEMYGSETNDCGRFNSSDAV